MQSPVFWHPFFYRTAMKLAYGKKFAQRYEALEKYIPEGSNLFEACMGDAYFYLNYLEKKNIIYSCADINEVFVKAALKKNLNSSLKNIQTGAIPKTDYILLQASLYYFIPEEQTVIRKLLDASNKRLIISESIENLSNSSSAFTSSLGTFLSKAKAGQSKIKFNSETLKLAFKPFEKNIKAWEENAANKEVIIVLEP